MRSGAAASARGPLIGGSVARVLPSSSPAQVLLRPRQLCGCPVAALGRRRTTQWRAAALPNHGVRPVPFDPDTYEEDVEDEDDYRVGELLGEGALGVERPAVVQAPQGAAGVPWRWHVASSRKISNSRGNSSNSNSNSSSNSSGDAEGSGSQDEPAPSGDRQQQQQQHGDVLGRAYGSLLLAAAAVRHLLTSLQTAVVATARVSGQLGREALHTLRHNTVEAKVQASDKFANSAAGKKVQGWREKIEAAQQELPDDLWGKVMWLWDRPHMQKIRLTVSMANFSIRLPALVALVATQIGLLSTSLSLPMLAPLLLGTGMLLRSIRTNASLIFPRIGLLVVLLWLLWFANSVIQNTVAYLRKQGAIDQRLANNINSVAELTVLVIAGVCMLSMLGVNVSALLLPAGVLAAIASRDLSHNFLAGFFLMMVQPFRLGDRVGVSLPAGSPGSFGGSASWFEGVCEKVDLRYTSLRQGKRRLMVPNSAFLQQPFMILEDAPVGPGQPEPSPGPASSSGGVNGSSGGVNDRGGSARNGGVGGGTSAAAPVAGYSADYLGWQSYVNGAPVHQELAGEAAGAGPVQAQASGPLPPEYMHRPQQAPQQAQQAPQAPQPWQQGPLHSGEQGPLQQQAGPQQQQAGPQQQQAYPPHPGPPPPVPQYQAHGPLEHHMQAPLPARNGWGPPPGMPPPPYSIGGPAPHHPRPPPYL